MSSCAEKAQSRPLLNREVIGKRADSRPVRVVQFGGGVFLRGFADWMIDAMNRHDLFNGSVALVQSVDQKRSEQLRAQDGLYTVRLSGPEQSVMTDASHVVDVFSTWLSPQHDFTAFLRLAENPDWRYMISNTTENGLVWLDGDFPRQRAADSFPGRLTQLLYHRYRFFQAEPDRGVVCLPCELIPENGTQLYQLVLRHAQRWQLPASFTDWLRRACVFHNTLVDRIVAGYPSNPDKAEAAFEHLGYTDQLYLEAEPYHLWVIEGQEDPELPLRQAGLNVVWTDQLASWRELKVRILNGAHLILLPIAFCLGDHLVRQSLADQDLREYLKTTLNQAVLPFIELDQTVVAQYAGTVLERFANPALDHRWSAISLNAISKFRVRLIPSLRDAANAGMAANRHLCFSLAALILMYRGEAIPLSDDPAIVERFATAWRPLKNSQDFAALKRMVGRILSDQILWGCDLNQIPGLTDQTAVELSGQLRLGMRKAVRQFVNDSRSTSE